MTGGLLLGLCALLAVPTAIAPGSTLASSTYLLGLVLLVAAIWVGALRCTGVARRAWGLIALGASCWLIGDVLQRILPDQGENAVGAPDVFWLGSYPLIIAAVAAMTGARHLKSTTLRDMRLDVVTITAAALVGAWALLIAPNLATGDLSLFTIVSVLYPLGDVALFAMAATLMVTPGRRGWPLLLLTGCLSATFAIDCLFTVLPKVAPTLNLGRLDALLLIVNAMLGAAALHPHRADLVKPSEEVDKPVTLHRLRVVILGAALTTVSLAAALPWAGQTADHVVLFAASLVMSVTILSRLYGVVRDRERAEALLSHLASHDQLTGLANRSLLIRQMKTALAAPRGELPSGVVLFYVDLDGFKHINDTWGHAAGDHVLKTVALRLLDVIRAGDTVARLGGDEFVILCLDVPGSGISTMGQRVQDAIEVPISWPGEEIHVGASVGVFSADEDGGGVRGGAFDVDEILQSADVAMYAAKSGGGGVVRATV